MSKKRSILCFIIVAGVALLLASARHDISALVKVVRGQARVVGKTSTCEVRVDGVLYRGGLYVDTCRIYYPYPHGVRTNVPCFFVYARTQDEIMALRLGVDWIGTTASSRGNVEPIFKWLIISEIAETTFDLRDPEKGTGTDVVIFEDNAEQVYLCRDPGNLGREDIRIAIPLRSLDQLQ